MASIPFSATSSEQDPSPEPQLAGSPIQSQSGVAPSEKQPTTEPSLLPEEMWLNIFQLLDRSSLDQVRLGCRCWNRIVGNTTSLMNKYVVRVNRWTINDHRELFNDAILASSSRFTVVFVCHIEIKNEEELDWWHAVWKKLSKTIQSLTISYCRIPTNTLLDMLKETPNLKTLNYYANNNFTTGASVDFQLNQLSELVLRVDKHAETVNVFHKICPRLKQLYIFDESSTNEEAVVALVESVAHTLEELQFDPTEDMLDKLCRFQLPHLKTLFLKGDRHRLIPEGQIVRFIKSCSTITALGTSDVEIRSAALMHDLTVHLPNLTSFVLRTWPDFADAQPCKFSSFLRNLPHLEILDVNNSDIYDYNNHDPSHQQELSTLDLDGCQSPSLEKLDLTNHIIPKSALQTFLRSSPKIKIIWLFKCRLQASDIIAMVSQLQSLEDLKLQLVEVNLDDFALLEHNMNPSKLKFLKIRGDKDVLPCSELLITLLMRCPDIKQLRLQGHKIEDSVFEVILRNLVHLEELKIDSCCFSEERLEYLKANKCKSFKRIGLLKCSMLCES